MSRVKEKEKKKGKDILYYIILLLLLGVMAFSGFKVFKIASEYKQGTDAYDSLAEEVGAVVIEEQGQTHLNTRLELDWDKLEEKNPDIQAWLRCMGTIINYPVVQGTDNEYYLSHLPDGTWNNKGTIFVDSRCAEPFKGFLTIVYGHRMRDMNKSMFTLLGEYLEASDKPFFLDHPVMELYTHWQDYDVQIFGAAIIYATDEVLYNNYIYDEEDKQSYIDWIFANNRIVGYDNRVSVTTDDHIIMMSTCMPTAADDDKRIVVWGKLVEVDRNLSGDESN